MATIHIVPHTHWDREWYLPYQRFRLKLVHLMDGLLNLLASDPQYAFFTLDGQTILLEDYLEIRPEREAQIREFVQSGRLLFGPWYILPDEFLVSPEATIRNLLQGERDARRFGGKMKVGYIPDPFGHIGQMAQILSGFDIHSASVQRGLDEEPCEFWWQAPDGSRVLMAYLRDGYGDAWNLPANDPPAFLKMARTRAADLIPHSSVNHILLMFGTDHTEPNPATSAAIQYCNQDAEGDSFLQSNLPAYIQSVHDEIKSRNLSLPVIQGELRSSRRHHLLPGVLSTRVWIKQRNHACETLLERWAEPFSLFASQAVPQVDPNSNRLNQPASILRQAWKLLMKCHPHDSICGCSIDEVHKEMRPRFDQVEQIGEEITRQSLQAIAAGIDTHPPREVVKEVENDLTPIVVFNACDRPLSGEASVRINLPEGSNAEIITATGERLPCWVGETSEQPIAHLDLNRKELFELVGSFDNGRVSGPGIQAMVLQSVQLEHHSEALKIRATLSENGVPNARALSDAMQAMAGILSDESLQQFILEAYVRNVRLHFVAKDVPPLGYQTYWARTSTKITPPPIKASSPSRIQNEFLQVEVDPQDGTLSVISLLDGSRYTGLNHFVDSGDCGDEYNYCPPSQDALIQPRVRALEVDSSSPEQCITVDLELALPDGLTPDRDRRSQSTKPMRIRTSARLLPGVAQVDVNTWVDNPAGDHRLRVHFPAPFSAEATGHAAAFDGNFEIIERTMGVPQWDQTWIEQPVPQHPQRNFCTLSDGDHALTILNRGLYEAEALENQSGQAEIALTLLRCTGWLSRDDFPTRRGHAGPHLETPEAQMLGTWTFDYAILPHSGTWKAAASPARAFQVPLRAVTSERHSGGLPPALSFLAIEPETVAISAVKVCEDGHDWLARAVNLEGKEIQARLEFWYPSSHAERTNLMEQSLEPMTLEDGKVLSATMGAHKITTFRFR